MIALRKPLLMGRRDLARAYSQGFVVQSKRGNEILGFISEWEVIPQRLSGTSLMAVLERKN